MRRPRKEVPRLVETGAGHVDALFLLFYNEEFLSFFLSCFLSFFLSFLVLLLLPTHCTCRGLLSHLITFYDTHTLSRIPLDEGSARCRDLYLRTHNTHKRHPHSRRDSNLRSQRTNIVAYSYEADD